VPSAKVLADACSRMERCSGISPRRRGGVTSSNRPLLGGESNIEANQTGGIEHSFTVRNDRNLGGVAPRDRLLIQSMAAFGCCIVYI
jgi:hypothetical protein